MPHRSNVGSVPRGKGARFAVPPTKPRTGLPENGDAVSSQRLRPRLMPKRSESEFKAVSKFTRQEFAVF